MKVKVSCCLQFYIVTGGFDNRLKRLASTEILRKNGGTSWSTVASLPTPRNGITGVSLPDGHFLVSGEDILSSTVHTINDSSLQEVLMVATG